MINPLKYFKAGGDILGMNDRSFNYLRLNTGKTRLADDKLETKNFLKEKEIPFPETLATISNKEELEKFNFENLPSSFVLKPSDGYKGAGINIYYNRLKDGNWVLADRTRHSIEDLKKNIHDILEGQYSLSSDSRMRVAIFEERIRMINLFKPYSYRGIPDIRVVVYNKVPVMAMLRLPTKESHGKANLSLGAIGVGIDMARGVTTTAIKKGLAIESLPDTSIKLSGIRIPYWETILKLAYRCQDATDLGFLGVDIIIDKEKGPMVVELNARPGLGIQVANQAGLKVRLKRLDRLKNVTEARAVRLAKDLFGGEIEEEIENISGREVVGLNEDIYITAKDGTLYKGLCKIDTGAHASSVDRETIRSLGYGDVLDYYAKIVPEGIENMDRETRKNVANKLKKHPEIEKVISIKSASGSDYRMLISLPAKIKDREFIMKATVASRAHLSHRVLIGVRDLRYFLVDSTKK